MAARCRVNPLGFNDEAHNAPACKFGDPDILSGGDGRAKAKFRIIRRPPVEIREIWAKCLRKNEDQPSSSRWIFWISDILLHFETTVR